MRFFYFLLVLLALYSSACQPEGESNISSRLSNYFTLDSTSIELGNAMNDRPLKRLVHRTNGKEFLYFHDFYMGQLVEVDIMMRESTNYIPLEYEGPNGITQLGSFGMLSDSLLWVFDSINKLSFLTHKGEIVRSYDLFSFLTGNGKPIRGRFNISDVNYLGQGTFIAYLSKRTGKEDEYKNGELFALINLNDSTVEFKGVEYPVIPSRENGIFAGSYLPEFLPFGKKAMVNFSYTSHIYVLSPALDSLSLKEIPINLLPAVNETISRQDYGNGISPKAQSYFDARAYFHPVMWDAHRNLFYRLANKPQAETLPPSDRDKVKLEMVLLVLSENLELLAEIDLGDAYTPHAFVAEEGLFLRVNGQNEADLDMHILKWKGN